MNFDVGQISIISTFFFAFSVFGFQPIRNGLTPQSSVSLFISITIATKWISAFSASHPSIGSVSLRGFSGSIFVQLLR